MHLLNALPQRLDPGATPTFAGLISATLTAPAANSLTLAGGAGNTNVVLTPSGTGNVLTGRIVGVGVSPVSTSWDTTNARGVQFGLYASISESETSGALSYLSNAVLADSPNESSPNSYKRLDTGGASRIRNIFGTLTIDTAVSSTPASTISWVNQFTVNSAGVSIASTTAGSSGAGALVVQGGLATGAASYIGGALEAGALNLRPLSNSPFTNSALIKNTANDGVFFSNSDVTKYAGLKTDGTFATNGNLTVGGSGTSTFAGAVTVTGALKLGNAYVAGAVVGTGSITIQDSTGTTYRIPVLV